MKQLYRIFAFVFGIKKKKPKYHPVVTGIVYEKNGHTSMFNELVGLFNDTNIEKESSHASLSMVGNGCNLTIWVSGVSPSIVFYKNNQPHKLFRDLLQKQDYGRSKLFQSIGVPLMNYITEQELTEIKKMIAILQNDKLDFDQNILGDTSPEMGN